MLSACERIISMESFLFEYQTMDGIVQFESSNSQVEFYVVVYAFNGRGWETLRAAHFNESFFSIQSFIRFLIE